jgi:hypothetical protein
MGRRPALKVAVAVLVAVLGACNHRKAESPQFRSAFALFNGIYASKLDDAYGDPQIAEVLRLLQEVDPNSLDAPEATTLRDKIERGQAEFRSRMAALAREEQTVRRPVQWQGTGPTLAVDLAKQPPAPAAASGPTLGMTRDEFLANYANCFVLKGLYQAGARQGEAYTVKEGDCRARYPALAEAVVVLLENRVSSLIPMSEIRTVDAGPAAWEAQAPRAPAPPAPAPPPKTVRWLPGAPRPQAP